MPCLFQHRAHLAHALHQTRRGAQQEVGIDGVKLVIVHCFELGIALPVVGTAVGDDHGGVGRQQAFLGNGRSQSGQRGIGVGAAAQAYDFTEQMSAIDGHQRPLPDLVKNADRTGIAVAFLDLLQFAAECGGSELRLRGGARQLADGFDLPGDVVEVTRFGDVKRDAKIFQEGEIARRVTTAPGDHQIGAQLQQTFPVRLAVAANLRQLAGGDGVVAKGADADQLLPGTSGEYQLGEVGGECNDAPRRLGQDDFPSKVVGDA